MIMIIVMHASRDRVPYAGLTESGPVGSASAVLRDTPGNSHGLVLFLVAIYSESRYVSIPLFMLSNDRFACLWLVFEPRCPFHMSSGDGVLDTGPRSQAGPWFISPSNPRVFLTSHFQLCVVTGLSIAPTVGGQRHDE